MFEGKYGRVPFMCLVPHPHPLPPRPEEGIGAPGTELKVVMSCCVDIGNSAQASARSNNS